MLLRWTIPGPAAAKGIGLLLTLALVACRPSGCDQGLDEPGDSAPGVGGGDGLAPNQGDAEAGDAGTVDYQLVEVKDHSVARGIVQYGVSRAGVFVLDINGVVRAHEPRSFKARGELAPEQQDGGPAMAAKPYRPVALAVAQDGDVIALGHASGEVGFYRQDSFVKRGVVSASAPLLGLGINADGTRLVTLGRSAVLWDVAATQELSRLAVPGVRSSSFPLAQLSRDGSRVAFYGLAAFTPDAGKAPDDIKRGRRSVVVLWDASGEGSRQVPKAGQAAGFALSGDGTQVVTGDHRDGYDVYDAATGDEVSRVRGIDLASLAMSPAGTQVAVADTDGNVWLVPLDRPKDRWTKLSREGGTLNELAFGPAGRWLYGLDERALRAIDLGKLAPAP